MPSVSVSRTHVVLILVIYDYRSTMTVFTTQRTVFTLAAMARDRGKIAMLTCFDASFAALIGRAGVDV
jgi:hypothetical protein